MAYRQALKPAVRAACMSLSSRSSVPTVTKSLVQRASLSSLSSRNSLSTRPSITNLQRRCLSDGSTSNEKPGASGNVGFNFAGPKSLNEVLRIDLISSKTPSEVQDLWLTYHETKPNVHGLILPGQPFAKTILQNANKCPYFIFPIFRESGFFMLLSQFMSPNHFLLAYLEDYKLDPARAQPLVSVSVFDELVESHDLTLVRCDVINKAVSDHEAYRVVESLLYNYKAEEGFEMVQTFNLAPEKFDVDDYISRMSLKWREKDEGGGMSAAAGSGGKDHLHVMDTNATEKGDEPPRPSP